MNAFPSRSRFFNPRHRWLGLIVACALAFSGCLTTSQVSKIVRDSNYDLLLSAVPGLETGGLSANPGTEKNQTVDEASARIEAFLAQHPDDPAMASALRLRQALLHLNHGAFSLAENAFAEVKPADLHTARDQAIHALREPLLWWSQQSLVRTATFFSTQKESAQKWMRVIATQAQTPALNAAPDLRDYFLEMRAWIGLKLGLADINPASSRETLQDAISLYTASFTPVELGVLAAPDFKPAQAYDRSTRRVLRARTLLETLAKATRDQANAPLVFSQPQVQAYYANVAR